MTTREPPPAQRRTRLGRHRSHLRLRPRAAALELARHGRVVLVGRNPAKLDAVKAEIEQRGGAATTVAADLSDVTSARRGAAQVAALGLPVRGVLNNAGVMLSKPAVSAQGWELVLRH